MSEGTLWRWPDTASQPLFGLRWPATQVQSTPMSESLPTTLATNGWRHVFGMWTVPFGGCRAEAATPWEGSPVAASPVTTPSFVVREQRRCLVRQTLLARILAALARTDSSSQRTSVTHLDERAHASLLEDGPWRTWRDRPGRVSAARRPHVRNRRLRAHGRPRSAARRSWDPPWLEIDYSGREGRDAIERSPPLPAVPRVRACIRSGDIPPLALFDRIGGRPDCKACRC